MNKFEIISQTQWERDIKDYSPKAGVIACESYQNLRVPTRATKHSAGYDFFSTISFKLKPGQSIKIPTGIKCHLDYDKALFLFPRSSLGFKYRMQLDNSVGIVDADYVNNVDNEGHIFIKITNDSKTNQMLEINRGDAFAQGIIMRYEIAEEEPVSATRSGGIGSTGK